MVLSFAGAQVSLVIKHSAVSLIFADMSGPAVKQLAPLNSISILGCAALAQFAALPSSSTQTFGSSMPYVLVESMQCAAVSTQFGIV
jgi:hypothetical protein